MKWILNAVWASLLLVMSPVILWRMIRHGRYRRGWKEKLFGLLPRMGDSQRVLWFHAVSVGEVLLLQKIVERFRDSAQGEYEILITTSTDTGFDLAEERFPEFTVSWFPLDFSWAAERALERVNPEMVVLVELEMWPGFLRACRARGVRTALVNARLSEKSYRGYSRIALLRPLFAELQVVGAQTEEYAGRLISLGVRPDRVRVTGSVKFDGVLTDRGNPATDELRRLFCISSDETVFIAGSTQSPEEQMALEAWAALKSDYPQTRLILVPRHRERFDEVAETVLKSGHGLHRRSSVAADTDVCPDSVILLDTIGELSACWGLADIAFVGGSFGNRGGQNMLEPAAFGAAVMFGPNTWNFRDIVERLLWFDAAIQLNSPEQLDSTLRQLLDDAPLRAKLGMSAQQFVTRQRGALQETADLLLASLCDGNTVPSENRSAA